MNSQTGLFNKQTPALTYLNKQKKMFQTYFKKIKYIIKNIVSKQPDLLKLPILPVYPVDKPICRIVSHRIISKQTQNINDILSRKEGK